MEVPGRHVDPVPGEERPFRPLGSVTGAGQLGEQIWSSRCSWNCWLEVLLCPDNCSGGTRPSRTVEGLGSPEGR